MDHESVTQRRRIRDEGEINIQCFDNCSDGRVNQSAFSCTTNIPSIFKSEVEESCISVDLSFDFEESSAVQFRMTGFGVKHRSAFSLSKTSKMDRHRFRCRRSRKRARILTIFPFLTTLLLGFIIGQGSASSPLREAGTCGPFFCKGIDGREQRDSKFHYKEGSVYSYQYIVNGTTSVQGGPQTQSGLHLSAKVAIRFLTACDAILFLKDVDVWQSFLSGEDGTLTSDPVFIQPNTRLVFMKSLEEFPLRFSYGDGLIEEICPHSEESSWALNIKRGFLSAFQNTMRRLDLEHNGKEDDIHGQCNVRYELGSATSSALTIDKVKNMNSCGDKFGILSAVQGTPYSFGTLHQSMPAVVSTSECQHVVDRNLLSRVLCSESHRLQSLARGASGAYMIIQQNLELVSIYAPPLVPSFSKNDTFDDLSPFDDDDDEEDELDNEDDGEDETKSKQKSGQNIEELGNAPWIVTTSPDVYISTLISKAPETISRRESLLFRHDYNLGQAMTDYNTGKNALAQFCASIKTEVDRRSGQLFESLVFILRGISPDDMMSLSKDASQICHGDRSPFDDALEAVGTASSLEVIRDRILREEASTERIKSWINSLSFIPKPDLALLTAAVPILRVRDNYPAILLTFSSLAHSYCNQIGHQVCSKHQPIAILIKLYEKYFAATTCLTKSRKAVDQGLMYLKGIGNFGVKSDGILSSLNLCIKNNDKVELRVAAIDAFRRMPCEGDGDVAIFRRVLENPLEDAEARISAFIALMRCPTYPTIRWIKQLLDREEVNQVGSFVWTYLTNLQQTALPSKSELQGLLADEILVSKFSTDIRKFSRNVELSTFYEDANFGLGLDGNLIFSQNSYLPRSASINLTVDLFGESINVFEGTMRTESLEHYVESIFGPNEKLSSSSNSKSSVGKKRERRAAPSKRKMRTLAVEYEAMKRYYADPIASISLRTFGNEIYYKRMVGIVEQADAMSGLNPLKMFGEATTENDHNWKKSRLLLDSSYIIPTGVGLPLNLSAQASSILRFEGSNDIDFLEGFKVKGKFMPSAMITVVGSMTLSAWDIHTGLKLSAHLRSSTAMDGTFHIKSGRLVDIEFGIPKTQLELLEYKSDLMFIEGADFRVVGQAKEQPNQNPICTGGIFYKYLGFKLCSSSYISLKPSEENVNSRVTPSTESLEEESPSDYLLAPYFPLNGPSYFILTLDKANPSLLKTRFHYAWNNNQTNTELAVTGTTFHGESRDTTQEKFVGLIFNLDKSNPAFNFDVKSLKNFFKSSGQLKKGPYLFEGDFTASLLTENNQRVPLFATSASFTVAKDSGGGRLHISPVISIKQNSNSLLEAKVSIEAQATGGSKSGKTFTGTGDISYLKEKILLTLDGGYNETSISFNWECTSSSTGTKIKATSSLAVVVPSPNSNDDSSRGIDSQITFEFSEFPQYNFLASWRTQVNDEGFDHAGEFSAGQKYLQKGQDTSNLWLKIGGLNQQSYEGSRHKWLFLVSQPSQNINWGLETTLNTEGKSFYTNVKLRYGPDKNLETSLSLKRTPGVLKFMNLGWNITLPSQLPVQVSFNLEEKAHRIYQSQFLIDWERDKLLLDLEFSDRSNRIRFDIAATVGITTNAIDNLKLGFHALSEDKDTKIRLSSEYKTRLNVVELGHSQKGRIGRKHKLYGSLTTGDVVYLVMSELDMEHGFQCILKTDLGSKFADIFAKIEATNSNGMQRLGVEYSWDASRDRNKQLLLKCFVDLSRRQIIRTESLMAFPGYDYFLGGDASFDQEKSTGTVAGRLSWKKDKKGGHLHLNGRLGPRRSRSSASSSRTSAYDDDDGAYDGSLQVATPFPAVKNVSFNLGLDFLEERSVCQINFDGTWGDDERLSGSVVSKLQPLSLEESDEPVVGKTGKGSDGDPYEEENEITRKLLEVLQNKFKFTLVANMTSTIRNLEVINLKLSHSHHSYFNLRTDVDIQFPNEKEISLNNHWVVPESLSDLLSTRAEFHIKTPFVGYQNVDLQAILGRKEDQDVLALIGIYIENFQYAISISGTPRFEEDGALGFDVTTSNPKYDKIFGSFSYVIGENTRVACQLGWPQVVIGIEAGWEWAGWKDFKVYYTFNSPWLPMKNVNTLVKVDGAQLAEFKFDLNEDSINAKCEWVIVSWSNLDIRLDGTTPFEQSRKFGVIVKNYWEDLFSYHSQVNGWVNDQQVGYKLEGGHSEVDEPDVVAQVMNSQLEIDTIVYPAIRGLFNLAVRNDKFNLAMSLTLREGPINIEGQLDLFNNYRFEEHLTITTPYPGLFELQLTLSPAVIPEQNIYNVGVQSKWRSHDVWYHGGVVIRLGPQLVLQEVLIEEEIDRAAIAGEDDYEGVDDKPNVSIPMSQLFHFYSPLKWGKVIKLEYESLSDTEELKSENPTEYEEEVRFPIRNFIIVYSADDADFNTELHNSQLTKKFTTVLDLRLSEEIRHSYKFDGLFDLSESEGRLNLLVASYHPVREYGMQTSWTAELPQYLQGKLELKTPVPNWETQTGSFMYANNEDDSIYTVDVELVSLTFEKLATNVAIGPRHFSMTLNTPFQGLEELEVRGDTTSKEDDEPNTYNTLITVKNAERSLEIDVDSLMMDEQKWPKTIRGTVSSSLTKSRYQQGKILVALERSQDNLDANGELGWENNQKLVTTLHISLSSNEFREFNLTVDTPFKDLEHWEMWTVYRPDQATSSLEIIAKTPFELVSNVEVQGSLEHGSSLMDVKKAVFRAKSPMGMIGTNASWNLESLTRFNVNFEPKYSLSMDAATKSNLSYFAHLPNENGLKVKVRNFIPTLNRLTTLDTRAYVETMQPSNRLSAGILIDNKDNETTILKLLSKYHKSSYGLEMSLNSNSEGINNTLKAQLDLNSTGVPSKTYRSNIEWTKEDNFLVDGQAVVEWGSEGLLSSSIQSTFNCSWPDENEIQLNLQVGYPSVEGNDGEGESATLLSIDGSFNQISGQHSARIQIGKEGLDEKPIILDVNAELEGQQSFSTSIDFASNFELVSEVGAHLSNKIDGGTVDGMIGGYWQDDKLNIKYLVDYESTNDRFKLNISLDGEVPFSTESVPKPQNGSVLLFYETQQLSPTVAAEFQGVYNNVQLIKAKYNQSSESVAGLESEDRHLEVENHFWPFGLNTKYNFDYSGGYEGLNLPTKMVRRIEVYDLGQPDLHKLEGELQIKTNFTGSEIALTGKHPKRKVQMITDYNFLDHQFQHNSRLSWKPDSWSGYELVIMNHTNDGKTEHKLGLQLTYPLRVITLNSGYKYEGSLFRWTAEMNPNKSKSDKKLLVELGYNNNIPVEGSLTSSKTRKVWATIKHPALTQDVRVQGTLQTNGWDLIETKGWMDYTGDLNKALTLSLRTEPRFSWEEMTFLSLPYWNVSTDIRLQHLETNLDLKSLHSTRHSAHELSIITLIDFKNSKKSLAQESKIAFELFKQLRKAHIMLSDHEHWFGLDGQLSGQHSEYILIGEMNLTGIHPSPKARMTLDLEQPYYKMYAVHGEDLTKGLYSEGGVIDSRNVKFDIWQSYNNISVSDVSYFLRLNHSKLITSKLKWRPELFTELKVLGAQMYENTSRTVISKIDQILLSVSQDSSDTLYALWNDAKIHVEPFLAEIREDWDFRNDYAALQLSFETMHKENDFYVQDILDYSQLFVEEISMRLGEFKEKLKTYKENLAKESYQLYEKTLLWLADKIKDAYHQLVTAWENYRTNPWDGPSISFSQIKEYLSIVAYYSIGFVVKLSGEIYGSLSSLANSIAAQLKSIVEPYQPGILAHIHQLEAIVYSFIVKVSDYFYATQDEIMRSLYYQKLANLAQDVDVLYKDFSQNGAATNIKKYYNVLKTFTLNKFSEIDDFRIPLGQIGTRLKELWEKVRALEWVKVVKESAVNWGGKIKWLIEYLNLDENLQELFIILYTKGTDLFSLTILEAGARHQNAKTKFIFDFDKGVISLEQKLPMPWAAFNETPDFKRLPEYQNVMRVQELFQSTKGSVWDAYYKLKPVGYLRDWLPPFDGHAMLVGPKYFFTFDGLSYMFSEPGSCEYILVADFVHGNFSVAINYKNQTNPAMRPVFDIVVSAGHNSVVIDLKEKGLRLPKRGQMANLPIQTPNLQGYRDGDKLVVESPGNVRVSCLLAYNICQIWVSGWYSRKTGGLLGTMDHEPVTDMTLSNGKRARSIEDLVKSWDISDDNSASGCPTSGNKKSTQLVAVRSSNLVEEQSVAEAGLSKIAYTCQKLFLSKMSSLQPCFASVEVDPYLEMCLTAGRDSERPSSSSTDRLPGIVCTASLAYVASCKTNGVFLRIPSICIKCDMNGEEMMDRDMKVISSPPSGSPSFRSTDLVFIVEAKDCNRALRTRRKIDILVKTLEEELNNNNFNQNRYAAVLFGGDGVFDKPHAILQNNEAFTTSDKISKHLASLSIGNGSPDIFNALLYSMQQLKFRPGASKTFILFPCSSCQPRNTNVDYADLQYAMLEQGVTLHILMNDNFDVDSKGLAKKVFGMDNDLAFTKAELEEKYGNPRQQVRFPKRTLGYCGPLALQTNGTIFSGKKLQNKREDVVEQFTTVFSRRIAQTASPTDCQTCYCSPNIDDGVGKAECFVCGYPRYRSISDDEDLDGDFRSSNKYNSSAAEVDLELPGDIYEDGGSVAEDEDEE